MEDKTEITIDKYNKSITFINNGIGFSQFEIANEILDLIVNLQEKSKKYKEIIDKAIEYNKKVLTWTTNEEITDEIANENLSILKGDNND